MKKIIFNLSMLVDEIIHKQMHEFKLLGGEAKLLQNNNGDEKVITEIHKKMSTIFYNLEPFEQRTRELYPKMEKLFDLFSNS